MSGEPLGDRNRDGGIDPGHQPVRPAQRPGKKRQHELYLQLTAEATDDLPVPDQPYTFGIFKRAEARGDLEALRKQERRVIRIHLGADVDRGLAALEQAMEAAVKDGLSVK